MRAVPLLMPVMSSANSTARSKSPSASTTAQLLGLPAGEDAAVSVIFPISRQGWRGPCYADLLARPFSMTPSKFRVGFLNEVIEDFLLLGRGVFRRAEGIEHVFIFAAFIRTGCTPTLSSRPWRLSDCMMTPMEPVMVSSLATMSWQGAAT